MAQSEEGATRIADMGVERRRESMVMRRRGVMSRIFVRLEERRRRRRRRRSKGESLHSAGAGGRFVGEAYIRITRQPGRRKGLKG